MATRSIPAPGHDVPLTLSNGRIDPIWYQYLTQNKGGSLGTVTEAGITLSDVSTNDVTNLRHGFAPKITGAAGYQLTSNGTSASWVAPVTTGADQPYINIMNHGGDNTGATNNDAAFDACWGLLSSRGGCIFFPAGQFKFSANINKTLPNTRFSVAIRGAGDGVTELYWPGGSGGMKFTFSASGLANNVLYNNMIFDGLTFVTGVANGGYGLWLTLLAGGYAYFPGGTTIQNCSWMGRDLGYSSVMCWTQTTRIEGVSFVNMINCYHHGALSPSLQCTGQGTYVAGMGGGAYGIVYNFTSCSWDQLDTGFIYGPWIQGVTFSQCNFNGEGGTFGILGMNDGGSILAQLCVSDTQFDNGYSQIFLNSVVFNTNLTNDIFTVSKDNGIGVHLGNSFLTQVIGNSFITSGATLGRSPIGTIGLNVQGHGSCSVVGNSFKDQNVGYAWQPGTSRCWSAANSFENCVTSTYNGGTSATPGTAHE